MLPSLSAGSSVPLYRKTLHAVSYVWTKTYRDRANTAGRASLGNGDWERLRENKPDRAGVGRSAKVVADELQRNGGDDKLDYVYYS